MVLQFVVMTPYGGQWMQSSRSVFKEAGRQGCMAAAASRPFPIVSLLLTFLFVVHLFSPLVQYPTESGLEFNENIVSSSSDYVPLNNSYSHDFAGTNLAFDGLDDATVRELSLIHI